MVLQEKEMTFEIVSFMLIGAYIATVTIWVMVVAPLKASRSRFIGRLNQKDWEITQWQLAYNKANNDFMKLAEIQQIGMSNSTNKEESTENQTANTDGWIDWTWTEEKPYPETMDTVVDVKFGDEEVFEQESVSYWQCSGVYVEGDCWRTRENSADTVVAYRVVN